MAICRPGGFGADHEQGHIRKALSRSLALEHVGVIAEARRRAPGHLLPPDFDRAVAERHVVIHAVGGNRPCGLERLVERENKLDLVPRHVDDLAGPARGQDEKFERPARGGIHRAQLYDERRNVLPAHGGMVPARNALASLLVELGLGLLPQLGLEPSRSRRRVRSAVVRLARVVEHGLDPAAQSPGRLRL